MKNKSRLEKVHDELNELVKVVSDKFFFCNHVQYKNPTFSVWRKRTPNKGSATFTIIYGKVVLKSAGDYSKIAIKEMTDILKKHLIQIELEQENGRL